MISEASLKAYDYPFLTDVDGVSGYDLAVPIRRTDGLWALSIWVTNFLDDHNHHTRAYNHAGYIPLGRFINLDGNLFAETTSGFKGPWALTLYRAKPSAIEPMGKAVAQPDAHKCIISGEAAPLLKRLPSSSIESICLVFSAPRDYYDYYGQPGFHGSGSADPR